MSRITEYYPEGVCSQAMVVETEGDHIVRAEIFGGCSGNLQGISRLIAGMRITDAIARLEGIDCAGRGTSCPDQLAKALRKALSE